MKSIDAVKEVAIRVPQEITAVREEIEKQNIKFLFADFTISYQIFATKPVVKFEDFKGLKVRSYGLYVPQAIKAAGGVGVTVHPAEVYEALKRNVIQASLWPLPAGYLMRNHEVAPHVCLWEFQSCVGYNHMINMDVWNSLPADVRKIILEVEKENYNAGRVRVLKHIEEGEKKLKADGAIIHQIPDLERQRWIDACPDFLDQWVQSCEKAGKGDTARRMRDLWLEIVEKHDK